MSAFFLSRAVRYAGAMLIGLVFATCLVGCSSQENASSNASDETAASAPDDVSSETSDTLKSGLFDWIAETLNDFRSQGSADSVEKLIARLNNWTALNAPKDWKPDPLVETLPEDYRSLPPMRRLSSLLFNLEDGPALREAIWLRDTSRGVAGKEQNELEQALLLFDWTTRNIQLEPDSYAETPYTSPETLFYGRGTVEDRAWIFILQLRQVGISAARLELIADEAPTAKKEEKETKPAEPAVRPALIGALIKEELYLFDAAVGLPIPGPKGKDVATLAQAAADDAVLRQMDVDDANTYPLKAENLKKVRALVAASPFSLSLRMQLVEAQLAGAQRIVFSVKASEEADRFKEVDGVSEASLWHLPFERALRIRNATPEQQQARAILHSPFQIAFNMKEKAKQGLPVSQRLVPALELGRVRQLMTIYGGEDSAVEYFLAARPNNEKLVEFGEQAIKAGAIPKEQFNVAFDIALRGKQNATFWMGVMALERKNYSTATDYLEQYSLKEWPNGPWTPGARYNLARTLEATGETEKAIEAYKAVPPPQRYGCLLRAKRLAEKSK